jgi:hypothetical protein
VDLSAEGSSAQADWDDLVAPSWSQRLALYATLPTAAERLDPAAWDHALTAGLALEASLLSDVGFVFESSTRATASTAVSATASAWTGSDARSRRPVSTRPRRATPSPELSRSRFAPVRTAELAGRPTPSRQPDLRIRLGSRWCPRPHCYSRATTRHGPPEPCSQGTTPMNISAPLHGI